MNKQKILFSNIISLGKAEEKSFSLFLKNNFGGSFRLWFIVPEVFQTTVSN